MFQFLVRLSVELTNFLKIISRIIYYIMNSIKEIHYKTCYYWTTKLSKNQFTHLRALQPIGPIYSHVEDYGGGLLKIPTKLKDILKKVRKLDNKSNSDLLLEFYNYLRAVTFYKNY